MNIEGFYGYIEFTCQGKALAVRNVPFEFGDLLRNFLFGEGVSGQDIIRYIQEELSSDNPPNIAFVEHVQLIVDLCSSVV